MTIKTIGELIAQLQEWPPSGHVLISTEIDAPGCAPAFSISSISGFAGSRIDGSDSGVCLNYHREDDCDD